MIFILCIALFFSQLHANQFVIESKPAQAKKNNKVESCQLLMQALQQTPEQLALIAQMQEQGLALVMEMMEGDFFSGLSKQEVQQIVKDVEHFLRTQERIAKQLDEQVSFLNSLNNSSTIVTKKAR